MGPSPCADPFATPNDLADRWRPLTPDEDGRAAVQLEDASRLIRQLVPDIDDRIADQSVDAGLVTMVCCAVVRRAMIGVAGGDGVTQQSQTVGPFSLAQSYSNPTGGLYLRDDELTLLNGTAAQGRSRRAFAFDMTPTRPDGVDGFRVWDASR